ncbi:MAG: KaiC domain-containing protein [Candidatus Methanomethyliaceae archaeon]|nr:KaiC domain-containing protein [Candidatus Methanomethyliaceae archaeon]MCX8169641.1 KaiC domain-containing protein [Candidatus Methanomethyliaceae archaeon]
MAIERLSFGISELDKMLAGGIPRGFFIAVTGEPGTGKTVLCIHFIAQGIKEGDKCIYVTTEESKESIITQAEQFGFAFSKAIKENKLIIIDALMGMEEKWSIKSLTVEELVDKVVEAKKCLGYGRARLVIDSLSAFWLDKPAMARRYSYFVKKVLAKWDFTILTTSQYSITTSEAFGWGIEHIADGIIRFRRFVKEGMLKRYIIIEKMRQTPHSLRMYEINIQDGKGLIILGLAKESREDLALPKRVIDRIEKSSERKEYEI